ncbi:MAG: DUF3791 domain-containing protein [Bacteroidales bacterium]|jgi:hypothetical protein|nr:DUF3791 domain-containing protein [Bacteroidales bacterium]
MNPNIETAVMPFKVQQLVEIIMQKKQLDYQDAFLYLYTSDCYKLLQQQDTKLWYVSGLGIYEMLEEEKKKEVIENKKIMLFFAFCLEKYKDFKGLSAEETLLLFKKHNVFDFLQEGFEVLHTQGENYILQEIDLFIKTQMK